MLRPKYISIIKWIDQSYTQGPLKREEVPFECIGETTGFLITEDKKHIVIAAEWFEFREDFRHVIHIPKCAVIKHRKIKVGK